MAETISLFGSCGFIECPDPLTLLIISLTALIFIAVYIYSALALSTLGKKLGQNNLWLAWIPFINFILILQMGNFHWAWIFLLLIPFLGWIPLTIIGIVAFWRICEKRNYPGWLSLLTLLGSLPGLIVLGVIAWKDRLPLPNQ